jgi:hypothetical protein
MNMRLNCWEVKQCGREIGGQRGDLGVCPAATETRLHGTNNGVNAGRACWVVAGTLCGDRVNGTFARKYETCEQCDFFKLVKQEEGSEHVRSLYLLCRLK